MIPYRPHPGANGYLAFQCMMSLPTVYTRLCGDYSLVKNVRENVGSCKCPRKRQKYGFQTGQGYSNAIAIAI